MRHMHAREQEQPCGRHCHRAFEFDGWLTHLELVDALTYTAPSKKLATIHCVYVYAEKYVEVFPPGI
jgi:hypothetical protein